MEKKRLFKIMQKADRKSIMDMADKIKEKHEVTIIKAPEKVLTMIKMREPVKETLFYLGEVIVTECSVQVDGNNGMAVAMGDDYEKTLSMAIIDAACNGQCFPFEAQLIALEEEQVEKEEKENALFLKTMVNFNTMN